jgi:hypothetical protein
MTVAQLADERSRYDRPSRWIVPEGLPAFTESLFVIFHGIRELRYYDGRRVQYAYLGRHFRITPEGLEPLGAVEAGPLVQSVRHKLIPPGSTRFRWQCRLNSSICEIWIPRLGYTLKRLH